jgi:hypothetical protein
MHARARACASRARACAKGTPCLLAAEGVQRALVEHEGRRERLGHDASQVAHVGARIFDPALAELAPASVRHPRAARANPICGPVGGTFLEEHEWSGKPARARSGVKAHMSIAAAE